MAIKVTLVIIFVLALLVCLGLTIYKGVRRYYLLDSKHSLEYDLQEYRLTEEKKQEKQNKLIQIVKQLSSNIFGIVLFGILTLISLACLIAIPGNIHQVNTGEVAVVRTMGKVTGTREAGIYWDWYFVNSYELYDTKVREINIETQTYSKDNQIIGVTADLQYTIDSAQVDKIATEYGAIEKLESKITSIALDNIKSVFAQNTATDVINNRSQISANISQTVDSSINTGYYVNVKTIVLTNIDFTDDFEAAVAAKVAQEQKKQQALIEQEQQLAEAENNRQIAIKNAQAQAEAATTKANAEAEVARIKAQADQDVAKIEADTAQYVGRREAAVIMQKVGAYNLWTTIQTLDEYGNIITEFRDSSGNTISTEQAQIAAKNYIKNNYIEKWDGKLPTYYFDSTSGTSILLDINTD